MSRIFGLCSSAALMGALTAGAAQAQLADSFDTYANGTVLQGINGWQGWDNNPAGAGVVDNSQASSAPQSLAIGGGADAVNRLGSPTTGCWRFSVDTYVPTGFTGQQYLILLNTYNDAGPYNWSVELQMNGTTGMITDDFDSTWAGAPVPLDCWFKFQIDVDLDNDLCAIRIDLNCDGVLDDDGADGIPGTADDELISTGQSWSNRGSGAGATAIGAVDLFSNAASTIYYDNLVLEECPAPPFADSFDTYANATVLQGINGWQGWDNNPAGAGVVDNSQASSAPQSLAIGGVADAVNRLGNPTSGCWRFSVDTYVPTGFTGQQYLILLNTYNDAGPYNWSIELQMNGTTGMITDDFDTAWAGAPVPLDCWFRFQIDVDLDSDLCAIRIDLNCDGVLDDDGADGILGTADDELISTGQSWSNRGSGAGATAIGALDLFSNAASTIYYDNVRLEVCPPSFAATNYCGPAVPNSTGSPATISATGAQSLGAMDLTFGAANVPMNSFGYFLVGTAADNVPMSGGSTGTLCIGGTIARGVGLQILYSGMSNSVSIAADVYMLTPGGAPVLPGDTRFFQYWFRDVGSTSNFTDGLSILFQ